VSFPRYERYKESGVEWLGEVPVGWEVGALKYFVSASSNSIKTGPFGSQLTSSEMQSGDIKVYNQRNVIDGDLYSGDNYITAQKFKELSAFEAFPGDLLITTRGTIGKTAVLPADAEKGILHPCLIRVQVDPSKLNTRYLQTLLQDSHLLKTQISILSNATTIEVIYSDTLASLILPIPPLSEQHIIAAFLDRETAKIDELVAEQERLIALLKEKRQATISHAVIKGLNPDAPMKDSGIEWLGTVPVGWEVCALKRIASLKSGDSITADNIEEVGEYPVFGGNGLRGFTDAYTHEGHYALVGRQGALCGNVNYATDKFWASEHAVVVSTKQPTSTIWIGSLLREMNLNQYSVSAAQPGLSVEIISNLLIAVPPFEEQTAIAAFLDIETAKIDALVDEARQAIGLLKERRSALISAAVTGKIDVRGNNEFRGTGKGGSCERLLAEREADMRHECL